MSAEDQSPTDTKIRELSEEGRKELVCITEDLSSGKITPEEAKRRMKAPSKKLSEATKLIRKKHADSKLAQQEGGPEA